MTVTAAEHVISAAVSHRSQGRCGVIVSWEMILAVENTENMNPKIEPKVEEKIEKFSVLKKWISISKKHLKILGLAFLIFVFCFMTFYAFKMLKSHDF